MIWRPCAGHEKRDRADSEQRAEEPEVDERLGGIGFDAEPKMDHGQHTRDVHQPMNPLPTRESELLHLALARRQRQRHERDERRKPE